jgi:hypothetical protein
MDDYLASSTSSQIFIIPSQKLLYINDGHVTPVRVKKIHNEKSNKKSIISRITMGEEEDN